LNALIVGFGSIGERHARLLTELGCVTAVVSSRPVDFPLAFDNLKTAVERQQPEYVVIANATHLHHHTLAELAALRYAGTVLVEKPLFHRLLDVPAAPHRRFVAYNLRFHPLIQRLKALLESQQVLSVQAYAGQYLPQWRPGSDYRQSYSSKAEQGGGVLRDLSHELDYLTWMLGGWERVAALGGHFSSLQVSSDDQFALTLVTPACPIVSVQLNYLDRVGRRCIVVNTDSHTLEVDLVLGTLKVDGDVNAIPTQRDDTYRSMHRALLSHDGAGVCTLAEGLETVKLIEAAELAAREGRWIGR
jgi:predicted dehydrogenase